MEDETLYMNNQECQFSTFGIQAEIREIIEDSLDALMQEVRVYIKIDNRLFIVEVKNEMYTF